MTGQGADQPDATIQVILKGGAPPPAASSKWDHPLPKALLAFALTTVVGAFLTTLYQAQQWAWQQDHTARAERIEQRSEAAKKAIQQLGEAFSRQNHVVSLIAFGDAIGSEEERRARLATAMTQWFEHRRDWRVQENVLIAETDTIFQYPGVACRLAEIVRRHNDLGLDVATFLETSRGQPMTAKTDERTRAALGALNRQIYLNLRTVTGSGGLLSRLAEAMLLESREDRPPRSAWTFWLPVGREALSRETDAQKATAVAATDKYLNALRGQAANDIPLGEHVRWAESLDSEVMNRPIPQRRPPPLQGADAARRYIASIAPRIQEVRLQSRSVEHNYARIVFDLTLRSGRVVPSCECLRFESGKIVEVTQYFDPRATSDVPQTPAAMARP